MNPSWGPARLGHELSRDGVVPLPSRSGIYRAIRRAGLIDPGVRKRRSEKFKRWERGLPMELWQMDVVGGILLADGTELKCLTGVDDHSRFCVSVRFDGSGQCTQRVWGVRQSVENPWGTSRTVN